MFCSKCGGQIPDGGEFCAYCGSKLVVNVENTSNSGSFRKDKLDGPKLEPWDSVFRSRWQTAFPVGLFVVYAIVMTLIMLIRFYLFQMLSEGAQFAGMFGDIENIKIMSVVMWGLILGNHAYCILMVIGIWWSFAQVFDKTSRPLSTTPHRLMITAQYIMIAAYSVVFAVILLMLMDVEILDDDMMLSVLIIYGVLLTYHIVGSAMLKRCKHSVDYNTADGLGFSVGSAVIFFIIAALILFLMMNTGSSLGMSSSLQGMLTGEGIMEYAGVLILAFHVMSGIMLVVLNIWKGKTQFEYSERMRKERERNMSSRPQHKPGNYVPAWKRAEQMQKDE